jgi:hypothetical protein
MPPLVQCDAAKKADGYRTLIRRKEELAVGTETGLDS